MHKKIEQMSGTGCYGKVPKGADPAGFYALFDKPGTAREKCARDERTLEYSYYDLVAIHHIGMHSRES